MKEAGASVVAKVAAVVRARGDDELASAIEAGTLQLFERPVGEGAELFLVPQGLAKGANAWSSLDEPHALGEPWGRMHAGRWIPSLAAGVRIRASKTVGQVRLRREVEQRFLYGRDVRSEGVVAVDASVRPGDLAWVVAFDGTFLGFATYVGRGAAQSVCLKPHQDLGWYLREGG